MEEEENAIVMLYPEEPNGSAVLQP